MVDFTGLQSGDPDAEARELFGAPPTFNNAVKQGKEELGIFGKFMLSVIEFFSPSSKMRAGAAVVDAMTEPSGGGDCPPVFKGPLKGRGLKKLGKRKWPGIPPEDRYLGTGKHGVGWTQGSTLAKGGYIDKRTGKRVWKDQGQWTESSLEYASEKASTLPVNGKMTFDLPVEHGGVVFRAHSGEAVEANKMFLWRKPSGKFHGYPKVGD